MDESFDIEAELRRLINLAATWGAYMAEEYQDGMREKSEEQVRRELELMAWMNEHRDRIIAEFRAMRRALKL